MQRRLLFHFSVVSLCQFIVMSFGVCPALFWEHNNNTDYYSQQQPTQTRVDMQTERQWRRMVVGRARGGRHTFIAYPSSIEYSPSMLHCCRNGNDDRPPPVVAISCCCIHLLFNIQHGTESPLFLLLYWDSQQQRNFLCINGRSSSVSLQRLVSYWS